MFSKRHYECLASVLKEAKVRVGEDGSAQEELLLLEGIALVEEILVDRFRSSTLGNFNSEKFEKAAAL